MDVLYQCSFERRLPPFCPRPSPPPWFNVGVSTLTADNMAETNIARGNGGAFHLLRSSKCFNIIFHDCLSEVQNFSSKISFWIITLKLYMQIVWNLGHLLIRTMCFRSVVFKAKDIDLGTGQLIQLQVIPKNEIILRRPMLLLTKSVQL